MAKKLIEVALPLEKINTESAREKSIRFGHPSTLHLWWARRPLTSARAVIWSSLIDDPSEHPERFPTDEDQIRERKRLFSILEDLVLWENTTNKDVLNKAIEEIKKSTKGQIPVLLDPFSGGGTIPIEAQRLGLDVVAHDLNPVAVMINKAMVEIPPLFKNYSPINPEDSRQFKPWENCLGLAADVTYYGEWMRSQAEKCIGHLYPKVKLPNEQGGGEAKVIAWLWARMADCPNPNCKCKMPLVSNYAISKKKGQEAWIEPRVCNNKTQFIIHKGVCPKGKESPKEGRAAVFKCPACGGITTDEYVKAQGKNGLITDQLMAVVAEYRGKRIYIEPDNEQAEAANVQYPENYPDGYLSKNPRWFSPPAFGMEKFSQLFTHRQMVALTTYSELIKEAIKKAEVDGIKAGLKDDHISLSQRGQGALAYAQAIGVYLAFGISRMADIDNNLCPWEPVKTQVRHLFGRQAIPMLWDFGENNIFNDAAGDFRTSLNSIVRVIQKFSPNGTGIAEQLNAQEDSGLKDIMISTDPPYYDNIGYADLSDFFYIWIRHNLKEVYPDLFGTLLVPKAEELVSVPYRFDGNTAKAKAFFEDGMLKACRKMYFAATDEYPVTIFYAYKQNDDSSEDALKTSSGWETMLSAVIKAGFAITGTWPMRTELTTGLKGRFNVLASSVVLVCRKRPEDAEQITRRNLINALRRELRPALKHLQESNIAPVDLAQSAIGPGMGVYSRYRRVLEADGSPMTVRSALQVINEEIDLFFNEQVGDLDAMSRFCVDLYTQNAFNDIKFGDADILARAKGTSVAALFSHDIVYAKAGTVHLIERTELSEKIDHNEGCIWLLTQQLTQTMMTGGVEACAKAIFMMFGSNAEKAKDLAYRLYTIAEQKKWANEAFAYNALVVAWPDIQSRAAMMQRETPEQMDMFSMGLLD